MSERCEDTCTAQGFKLEGVYPPSGRFCKCEKATIPVQCAVTLPDQSSQMVIMCREMRLRSSL